MVQEILQYEAISSDTLKTWDTSEPFNFPFFAFFLPSRKVSNPENPDSDNRQLSL